MNRTYLEDSSFWGKRPEVGSSETIEEPDLPDIDEGVKLLSYHIIQEERRLILFYSIDTIASHKLL